MRFKLFIIPILTVSLFAPLFPAFSQVVPAYTGRSLPLSVGFGPSSYDVDWGHGRMYGFTVWADYYPGFIPSSLRGLGVEIEARDISMDRSYTQPNVRQDTAGGGPIYTWRHFRNFHPYAKFLYEYGSYDFTVFQAPDYKHDTRSLWAAGGGLEYRVYRPIWVRADYEYQTWQTLLGRTPNPQGFTVGFALDFSHSGQR